MKEREDRDFFTPDLDRLEEDWLRQAKLVKRHGDMLAEAKFEYATIKAKLDVTRAEVERRIRRLPSKYKTQGREKAVALEVTLHPKTIKAVSDMNEAKRLVDHLEATVNALEHKKRSLENLVDLWTKEYYSRPREKPGNMGRMEEAEKHLVRSKGRRDRNKGRHLHA